LAQPSRVVLLLLHARAAQLRRAACVVARELPLPHARQLEVHMRDGDALAVERQQLVCIHQRLTPPQGSRAPGSRLQLARNRLFLARAQLQRPGCVQQTGREHVHAPGWLQQRPDAHAQLLGGAAQRPALAPVASRLNLLGSRVRCAV
jgi:hypothetical protein